MFYVLTALAVLTKGPVGIVLPGLIILSFLIYVRRLGTVWQELKLLWGIVVFSMITLPWYVLIYLENGKSYLNSFLAITTFNALLM